jgi:squalene-associated FAD-dependent desaturase
MTTVHVVGAGLSGLATALALSDAGRRVVVYEAGPAAGGRCRSYFDRGLGMRIDNGNHLLLSGNHATMSYLDQIGARHTLGGSGEAHFPFFDLGSNERWVVSPGPSRIPWWLLHRHTRIPGTKLRDYLGLLRLRRVRGDITVAALLGGTMLYTRLLEPLAVAALNTRPEHGLARLLARVVAETLLLGGAACIPSFPRVGLSESLVNPAIAYLRTRGAALHLGRRVAALRIEDGRVAAIESTEGSANLEPGDAVVLAVPPWVAAALVPGLAAPERFEAILNIHFVTDAKLEPTGFVGVIGGTAEWVFAKRGVVSVTISAANHLVDEPAEAIARLVWSDVRRVLDLPEAMPRMRVVKERRATFAATAEQDRRRPGARTALANLFLAGDWTATGLPATIEGAIRSGRSAAAAALAA